MTNAILTQIQLLVAEELSKITGKDASDILKDVEANPFEAQEYLDELEVIQTNSGEMYKDLQYDSVVAQIGERFISWTSVTFGSYASVSLSDIFHKAWETLVEVYPYEVTETRYRRVKKTD